MPRCLRVALCSQAQMLLCVAASIGVGAEDGEVRASALGGGEQGSTGRCKVAALHFAAAEEEPRA